MAWGNWYSLGQFDNLEISFCIGWMQTAASLQMEPESGSACVCLEAEQMSLVLVLIYVLGAGTQCIFGAFLMISCDGLIGFQG